MDNLTASNFTNCGFHEITPGLDGQWFEFVLDEFGGGGCLAMQHAGYNFFWQVGTNHVQRSTDIYALGGHDAMGNGSYYTNIPGPSEGNCAYQGQGMVVWDMNNPGGGIGAGNWAGVQGCNTSLWGFGGTSHMAWLNNLNDSYSNKYPSVLMFHQSSGAATQTYEEEIVIMQMNNAYNALFAGLYRLWASSPPTVWRAGHTFNDPDSDQCTILYMSPNISLDGQYVTWTSDWQGATGTGTCTNNRRDDVFIAYLPH